MEDKKYCYKVLNKVSRSFAGVIAGLPEELKDAVAIFYLVLRGLDSVEDDMTFENDKKIPLLLDFHNKIYDESFYLENVGDKEDYRDLMRNFPKVTRFFLSQKKEYQDVIADITKRMGEGMVKFISSDVKSQEDFDEYCHYVAGLVGIGLSNLFLASGLEVSPKLKDEFLSNEMGLFLQKTNIIRDYHEDLEEGRLFWPSNIWTKYALNIGEFNKNPKAEDSLKCMNELIIDGLRHVPNVIEYLSALENKKIFNFCAIPQIMAIATMNEIFNNSDVFIKNVKIKKTFTLKVLAEPLNIEKTKKYFVKFLNKIQEKSSNEDRAKIADILSKIENS